MKNYILSAGIIVVRFIDHLPHYLLLRVFNYWDFPKGEVEKGEDPLKTAIRELREETSLEHLTFRWGHDFRETPPYGKGKVARYYLAESSKGEVFLPVDPVLRRPEHHQFLWLPYDGARIKLTDRLKPILDWAREVLAVNGRNY